MSTHHRLSDLLGCEVVDESGGTLGHVHDVVCDRRPAEARVSALLVRSAGLFSRLGLPGGRRADRIDWQDVRRIEGHRIVVLAGARVRRE
ncbi:MAG TPA: PRC-barrel domain-containing protein [Candidatus Dormibacteraeota bacterium]